MGILETGILFLNPNIFDKLKKMKFIFKYNTTKVTLFGQVMSVSMSLCVNVSVCISSLNLVRTFL